MRKNKLLLLLALLLTAATGAWADEVTFSVAELKNSLPSGNTDLEIPYDWTVSSQQPKVTIARQDDLEGMVSVSTVLPLTVAHKITVSAPTGGSIDGVTFTTNPANQAQNISASTGSCSKKGVWSPGEGDVTSVTFTMTNNFRIKDIVVVYTAASSAPASGYSVTMKDGVKDADKWTVKVGDGQAQALPIGGLTGDGTETVTLQYNGRLKVKGVKATSDAVPATVPVTSITLNKTETSIKVGATETLSVTSVLPEEATDKTYTWKTSDASKATVDQDGKVTAVAEGTVTIYAEANDGSGVKGNCTVTVTSATPEYYNKLTKINDNFSDQVHLLKQLGRGRQAYNSSLTAAQAYALATYQAAIDGKAVYVIMSSQDDGYEIHYAVSTDASATEHTAALYDLCSTSNTVRMYYVAQ